MRRFRLALSHHFSVHLKLLPAVRACEAHVRAADMAYRSVALSTPETARSVFSISWLACAEASPGAIACFKASRFSSRKQTHQHVATALDRIAAKPFSSPSRCGRLTLFRLGIKHRSMLVITFRHDRKYCVDHFVKVLSRPSRI